MGGSYYDRDVEVAVPAAASTTSSSSAAPATPNAAQGVNSTKADSLFQGNHGLHDSLNPKGRTIHIGSGSLSPIVVAVDVTGSMGVFAKCIWDKLPMFYGQLCAKNYVTNPTISFAGVGDSYTDKAPLQISDFKQGSALDESITKLYLEGGGGGQHYESYELCAYFYDRHCTSVPRDDEKKSFFFFIGDEGFYAKIKAQHIENVIGDPIGEDVDSGTIFASLRKKYHVFFIHKPYWDKSIDAKQLAKWKAIVGAEKVLELTDPKAIVDIMLGAISIVGRTRNLAGYVEDMESRGQTQDRIKDVKKALQLLSDKLDSPTFPGPAEDDGDEVPNRFLCPITMELMNDPVTCADGYSYEREALEFWLTTHNESPQTGAALASKTITSNNKLKEAIQTWKIKHNQ